MVDIVARKSESQLDQINSVSKYLFDKRVNGRNEHTRSFPASDSIKNLWASYMEGKVDQTNIIDVRLENSGAVLYVTFDRDPPIPEIARLALELSRRVTICPRRVAA